MKIYAVHFMGLDFRPQSGSEKPWKIGETRTITGKLALCERGYHYSPSWESAFLGGYLYGPLACIVEVATDGPYDAHKGVSATRKLVEAYDVTKPMRLFAADEASRALKAYERNGKKADPRSWAAVKAARAHAYGRISDDDLAAAWYAARDAARAAAWDAARDAARAAAWDAAWYAARDAAWDASAKRFSTAMHDATGWTYEVRA